MYKPQKTPNISFRLTSPTEFPKCPKLLLNLEISPSKQFSCNHSKSISEKAGLLYEKGNISLMTKQVYATLCQTAQARKRNLSYQIFKSAQYSRQATTFVQFTAKLKKNFVTRSSQNSSLGIQLVYIFFLSYHSVLQNLRHAYLGVRTCPKLHEPVKQATEMNTYMIYFQVKSYLRCHIYTCMPTYICRCTYTLKC